MVSKKLSTNIHIGLWIERNEIWAQVWIDDEGYVISYHRGALPPFDFERVATLEELEIKMREFEPDLRKWHTKFE